MLLYCGQREELSGNISTWIPKGGVDRETIRDFGTVFHPEGKLTKFRNL